MTKRCKLCVFDATGSGGLCRLHFGMEYKRPPKPGEKKCTECEWKVSAKGLCYRHYQNARNRDQRKINDKRREKTGFTRALLEHLREKQAGVCAMPGCGREIKGRNECADHCHKTNRPRGLLCIQCNCALGIYERDKERHHLFDRYLAEPPAPWPFSHMWGDYFTDQ